MTRAGRVVRKPSHLKDYVASKEHLVYSLLYEHLVHCLLFAFDITHFHQCKKKGDITVLGLLCAVLRVPISVRHLERARTLMDRFTKVEVHFIDGNITYHTPK